MSYPAELLFDRPPIFMMVPSCPTCELQPMVEQQDQRTCQKVKTRTMMEQVKKMWIKRYTTTTTLTASYHRQTLHVGAHVAVLDGGGARSIGRHHAPNAGVGTRVHREKQPFVPQLVVQLLPRDTAFHRGIAVHHVHRQNGVHSGQINHQPTTRAINVAWYNTRNEIGNINVFVNLISKLQHTYIETVISSRHLNIHLDTGTQLFQQRKKKEFHPPSTLVPVPYDTTGTRCAWQTCISALTSAVDVANATASGGFHPWYPSSKLRWF